MTPNEKTRELIASIANEHGFSVDAVIGPDRSEAVAWARHDAMRRIHAMGGRSLKQIGLAFGGRDHTTVIYALNRRPPAPKLARGYF
jgi:chromosomal replication initiator protein